MCPSNLARKARRHNNSNWTIQHLFFHMRNIQKHLRDNDKEKSNQRQSAAWPNRREWRGHNTSKKNLLRLLCLHGNIFFLNLEKLHWRYDTFERFDLFGGGQWEPEHEKFARSASLKCSRNFWCSKELCTCTQWTADLVWQWHGVKLRKAMDSWSVPRTENCACHAVTRSPVDVVLSETLRAITKLML